MDLMLDAYCHYQTFADAVKVGHACDEMGYFWYEDPYHDGGITPFAHARLRELIRTPLLMGEKVKTLQERMNLVLAKATDLIRGDAPLDGITGTLKLAHAAEAVGMDIELHGQGPAHRHLMSAIRNSNYYEFGWTHPNVPNFGAPVYAEGYTDGFPAAVDEHGCVDVPDGPGLGVTYDWDYIKAHSVGHLEVVA
jgi:L-alanine-DL-glutamate epimerase-like enolase superfamily enzyme